MYWLVSDRLAEAKPVVQHLWLQHKPDLKVYYVVVVVVGFVVDVYLDPTTEA